MMTSFFVLLAVLVFFDRATLLLGAWVRRGASGVMDEDDDLDWEAMEELDDPGYDPSQDSAEEWAAYVREYADCRGE